MWECRSHLTLWDCNYSLPWTGYGASNWLSEIGNRDSSNLNREDAQKRKGGDLSPPPLFYFVTGEDTGLWLYFWSKSKISWLLLGCSDIESFTLTSDFQVFVDRQNYRDWVATYISWRWQSHGQGTERSSRLQS